ncbi:S8 family serine peptidase [Sagittula sp. MA-2]|jgi:subtilisin family serine protease|uniref:S8 family serine peptidase n=1 Tax=Sagittula sp. MA-2 TaxID=3048007 RepID=UPI0024C271B3|nr:S8 family serine peptidase [Sagittula sp. MA-2]WHZ35343.1 S8 family serine peptidase [Sagittula sp. MA-2]
MSRLIVLRDRADNWRRPSVPLSASVAPRAPEAASDPLIESVDLSPAELRDLVRDPTCLTVAPVMPTRIVNPEPLDDLRAEDAVPGWGLHAVGADWTNATGHGVRLALLDTGIDRKHPAFAGVRLITKDFVGTGVGDANGHGTHMAGTILGRDLGGTRIGVARGIEDLFVVKTLADNGMGRSDGFMQAVLWAAGAEVDIAVFALSFDIAAQVEALTAEGYPRVQANTAAVNAYRGNLRIFELVMQMICAAKGPLLLGAIGNDSLRVISPDFETGPAAPAAARHVLAVGACGPGPEGLEPAVFSNAGPALVAPGVGIISASLGGGLRSLNGSSMAAAHAAGVAALWVEQMRGEGERVTAQSLAAKLIGTVTRQGLVPGQTVLDCGHGLIQAPKGQLD